MFHMHVHLVLLRVEQTPTTTRPCFVHGGWALRATRPWPHNARCHAGAPQLQWHASRARGRPWPPPRTRCRLTSALAMMACVCENMSPVRFIWWGSRTGFSYAPAGFSSAHAADSSIHPPDMSWLLNLRHGQGQGTLAAL